MKYEKCKKCKYNKRPQHAFPCTRCKKNEQHPLTCDDCRYDCNKKGITTCNEFKWW